MRFLSPSHVLLSGLLSEPWALRFMNHHDFAFDDTFGETANNADVYEGTAQQLVLDALEGKQGTVMMPLDSRVVLGSLAQLGIGAWGDG